ncbi:hypothetical protein V8B97DRAFT_1968790 [Scleroderma yunnanense]
MRTFHPFSSPHAHMPDTAQLNAHLHNPPKSESSRPPSPTLNLISPNSNPISAQNADQIQSPHPQSSSSNGIPQLPHSPLTSAPPSVLSNPDPNASIQSILAANNKDKVLQQPDLHNTWAIHTISGPPPPQHSTPHHTAIVPQPPNGKSGKRKLDDTEQDDPHPKIRRTVRDHVSQDPTRVVSEQGERSHDQKAGLDNNMTGSFKFLHVTGTAKAKSFLLSLDIMDPPPSVSGDGSEVPSGRIWATFDSAPVTIISKPSKKTAKTRNISSCILAGGPVSLFNRINSQTVRTKYMTIESNQLCASNSAWSAFNVNVVRRPDDAPPPHAGGPQPVTYGCEIVLSDTLSNIATSPLIIRKVDKGRVSPEDGGPVSQMQKIALQRVNADGSRHYLSAAGPIPGAPGVVSPPTPGASSQGGTHPLIFQPPRIREELKDGVRILSDEVDDYLCWTIVGISKFQYTFFDAFGQNNSIPEMPITPFPTLFTTPVYRPANNTLEMAVSHFFYDDPKTNTQQPLAVYLGNIGPLRARFFPAGSPGPLTNVASFGSSVPGHSLDLPTTSETGIATPGTSAVGVPPARYVTQPPLHTIVTVDMPSLLDIIKALQEDVPPNVLSQDGAGSSSGADGTDGTVSNGSQVPSNAPPPTMAGRSLPLLFIRSYDGVGYHSGRTVTCENVFQSMDLGAMAPGHVLPPPGGTTPDPNWLAAAQAAASAEGGLHGWTLRIM